jgi:RNA polymerase sigma-70 factor (ECF subfamily)
MQKYQNALAKLTPEKRVAFLLNRVEGKKHKEIAEMLGISRKAVEKRIYTALEQLRKEIHEI